MTKKRLTMSDDLVERARHNANADIPHHASVSLIEEMADRIEELEAKLKEAMGLALNQCPFKYGTGSYDDWWQDRYERLAQLKGE